MKYSQLPTILVIFVGQKFHALTQDNIFQYRIVLKVQ